MKDALKLMAVFAHPDDESLGAGGTLAKYASEGVETYLLTATAGQRGWFGPQEEYPGPEALAEIRKSELQNAAEVLGIREVRMLEYTDGELDQADPQRVIDQIVNFMRDVRPQVVITFDPLGVYGHPDHIAISQLTTAAAMAAVNPDYRNGNHSNATSSSPHAVQKLYYMAPTKDKLSAYQAAFGDLVMNIDGEERSASGWHPWSVTSIIDTMDYWPQVWQAVQCHRSQLPTYKKLIDLPDEHHQNLWGVQEFYRAFSLVNGGRELENDLFQGLRG